MENCFSAKAGFIAGLFCIGFRAIPPSSSAVLDSTLHKAYGTVERVKSFSVGKATGMAWSSESRHKRGYGSAWDKIRKAVLVRDNHLCQTCLRNDRPTTGNQVDHIIPKAKGGTDDAGNLEAICDPCHKAKTARDSGKEYKPKRTTGVDGWPA